MKLRLTPRARQDIREIGHYINLRSPSGAKRVRRSIQDALQTIAMHSEIGRDLGGGLHRFVVPRLPYLIFYRRNLALDQVQVLTIRHAARHPEERS